MAPLLFTINISAFRINTNSINSNNNNNSMFKLLLTTKCL